MSGNSDTINKLAVWTAFLNSFEVTVCVVRTSSANAKQAALKFLSLSHERTQREGAMLNLTVCTSRFTLNLLTLLTVTTNTSRRGFNCHTGSISPSGSSRNSSFGLPGTIFVLSHFPFSSLNQSAAFTHCTVGGVQLQNGSWECRSWCTFNDETRSNLKPNWERSYSRNCNEQIPPSWSLVDLIIYQSFNHFKESKVCNVLSGIRYHTV